MSPKIEAQRELTTKNQLVSSLLGAPSGYSRIGGYREMFSCAEDFNSQEILSLSGELK